MNQTKYFNNISRKEIALHWLAIACGSLLVSGGLAFFTAIARTPIVSNLFNNPDFFRRVLVAHVVLGVAVWFTALPVAFFQLLQKDIKPDFYSRISASVSLAGMMLMLFTSFSKTGTPYLSNYIPIISHPLFITGLIFYLIGVALNYLNSGLIVSRNFQNPTGFMEGLQVSQMGVRLGALYYLVSIVTLYLAFVFMPNGFSGTTYYEVVMWGGGHTLQFASVAFMLVCWTVILSSWMGNSPISRREAFLIFFWLGIPAFFIPILSSQNILSSGYREGFTFLMRWGMFPPVVGYLALVSRRFIRAGTFHEKIKDIRPLCFMLGTFLILTGFVFGSLVRGPDLRLPGHYHASIGAVTISFMGACYVVLMELGIFDKIVSGARNVKTQFYMYGFGQWVFALGMFVAGSFGMSRKVYGTEQQIKNIGQTIGMWIMATGGVFALLGGFIFVYVVTRALLKELAPRIATKKTSPIKVT